MGVRVIDDDDADFCNSSCYSYDSLATTGTTKSNNNNNYPATTAANTATPTTTKPHYHQHESKTETAAKAAAIFSRSSKDLVGNCKEFRIENNKNDLRIIGNGNRIRIAQNSGNLVVIGNSTRLKITNNAGHIKYTGNEGRICLGSESAQQTVDYIGCNGILKIKTTIEMDKSKMSTGGAEKKTAHDVPTQQAVKVPLRVKSTTKSASFGGCASVGVNDTQWQKFNKIFNSENWQKRIQINTSLPNLKQQSNCQCSKSKNTNINSSSNSNQQQQHCKINNSISVVNNSVGNIVIKNAVNVRI